MSSVVPLEDDDDKTHVIPSAARHFIAGALAGIAVKLIEYPADTVKVRLQTEPGRFGSAWHCLRQMLQEGSVMRLYQGVAAPIFGAILENAIGFSSYSAACQALENCEPKESSLKTVALAGSISGAVVSFWMTPVELVKCRMQSQLTAAQYSSTWDCVSQTVRTGGVTSLFRGQYSTLIREIPGGVAYFAFYESVVRYLSPNPEEHRPLSAVTVAGMCGGTSYWTLCYPIDVVKSRQQTGHPGRFYSTLTTIYRTEGTRALFDGLGITLLRSAPSTAALFVVYEYVLRHLP